MVRVILFGLLMALPAFADDKVPVIFSDGHETDPRDRGRPVVLIAAALKVPPETFRAAFTHVHPAPGDGSPTPDQARANKAALMSVLEPLGVTNDRLDEVSNHYRYRRDRGEMWPTAEATAYATVSNGTVTGFVVTNPGSGYSSPPVVTVQGMPDVHAVAELGFDPDFSKNGAVRAITLAK
jgi:hypothetical protein